MKKLKLKGNTNLLIAGGALAACAVGAALYLRGRNGAGGAGEGTAPFMSFNTDGSAPFSVHNALVASLGGPWFGPKLPTFGYQDPNWDGEFGVKVVPPSGTLPSVDSSGSWTSATGATGDGSAPFGTRYTLDVMPPATY